MLKTSSSVAVDNDRAGGESLSRERGGREE